MKLLFVGTREDSPFLKQLQELLRGHSCKVIQGDITTLAEIKVYCKKYAIEGIITTNRQFVLLLSQKKKASLDDYAGSVFHLDGVPVVCMNPLEHFYTVAYGKHLAERYISKVINPGKWYKQSELKWELAEPGNIAALYQRFAEGAWLIACDIETKRQGLAIDVAGYCAIFRDGSTLSIVIPIHHDPFMMDWAQKFSELPQGKIFQNGMYDNSYFIRWGLPPTNWLWDTLHLFHCWYSEMPKSLDFITGYLLPNFQYWKDESNTGNRLDYYYYNAKDTWATANCFLALMQEMPQWAKDNYLIEFPLVYPSLHCSLEGIKIDPEALKIIGDRETKRLEGSLTELRQSVGNMGFNPNSSKQVLQLLRILGNNDIKSSGVKDMKKAASRHPFTAWYINRIINYREASKLLGSYINTELLGGRFMYALNPAGTDTGRLASKESHFWCGHQIQNIPSEVKAMFVADDGWLLAEVDKSQSEDRCVAYLSGDTKLLDIFLSGLDSHSYKGEMFFGVPYAEILQQEADYKNGKFVGMTIRTLTKRVNHGANYNMGDNVLLETMGVENVVKARGLLGLAKSLTPIAVCQYLLGVYNRTFPSVKGRWYNSIKLAVATTKKLVGATGWTRYCFMNPSTSKQALNAYVAHVPQSLSVMIVNKEFMNIWRWAIHNGDKIRLKAQIHDSIFFQYKDVEVVKKVESLMQTVVAVKGSDGVVRDLKIPNDIKSNMKAWGKLK